jgi:hypothetical protein
VRVLFEGKPLAGAKLTGHCRSAGKVSTQSHRTANDGRAVIKLDRSGDWLLRLVHMRPYRGEDADWESWWGSLTFRVETGKKLLE